MNKVLEIIKIVFIIGVILAYIFKIISTYILYTQDRDPALFKSVISYIFFPWLVEINYIKYIIVRKKIVDTMVKSNSLKDLIDELSELNKIDKGENEKDNEQE